MNPRVRVGNEVCQADWLILAYRISMINRLAGLHSSFNSELQYKVLTAKAGSPQSAKRAHFINRTGTVST